MSLETFIKAENISLKEICFIKYLNKQVQIYDYKYQYILLHIGLPNFCIVVVLPHAT